MRSIQGPTSLIASFLLGGVMLLSGCAGLGSKQAALTPTEPDPNGNWQASDTDIVANFQKGEVMGYDEMNAALKDQIRAHLDHPQKAPAELRPIVQLVHGFRQIKDENTRMIAIHQYFNKTLGYDHAAAARVLEGEQVDIGSPTQMIANKKTFCVGYTRIKKFIAEQSGIPAERMGELIVKIYDKQTNATDDHVLLVYQDPQSGKYLALNNTATRLEKGKTYSKQQRLDDDRHTAEAFEVGAWLQADPHETRVPMMLIKRDKGGYVVQMGSEMMVALAGMEQGGAVRSTAMPAVNPKGFHR